jgi:hypothetical protein
MFDYTALFEFSRNHCVAICAFLVPANLLATLSTLVLTGLGRPLRQIFAVAAMALLWAGLMVLHVMTWFLIGVVMVPTFVLLGLGSVCLVINLWAVLNPANLRRSLAAIGRIWVYIRSALSSQLT